MAARLQAISRKSPLKQEPGCKHFVSLAANDPPPAPQSRTRVAGPSLSSKAVRFRWSLQPVPDGLPSYYERLSAEDRRAFDRWLLANAVFGSIFAAVLVAMAFAGSRSIALRDAAVAGGTPAAFEVGASEGTVREPRW